MCALRLAAASPAFRPSPSLALLTEDGCAARAQHCVVCDAPWLLPRLRDGALRLASPALEAPLRDSLKLRRLSEAVRPRSRFT